MFLRLTKQQNCLIFFQNTYPKKLQFLFSLLNHKKQFIKYWYLIITFIYKYHLILSINYNKFRQDFILHIQVYLKMLLYHVLFIFYIFLYHVYQIILHVLTLFLNQLIRYIFYSFSFKVKINIIIFILFFNVVILY